MNHRAAGGRDCQGRAGDPEGPGDQDGDGWDGWAGGLGVCGWVGAGRGGGDYGECWGDWEVRSMAYCLLPGRVSLAS